MQVDGDTSFLELQIGNKGILALQNPPADIRYSLISPELSKGSKWLLAAAYTLPAGEVMCSYQDKVVRSIERPGYMPSTFSDIRTAKSSCLPDQLQNLYFLARGSELLC